MKRAALVLLTALIIGWPRPAASRQPYEWSPAPRSALRAIPAASLGVGESDRGDPSGAPGGVLAKGPLGQAARAPRGGQPSDLGSDRPAPSPAGRTGTPERLNPRPATILGTASWYRDPTAAPDGEYAALPGFKTSQLGMHIVVTGFVDGRAISITVAVVTSCQCYVGTPRERVVDLSPAAFAQFAPLSRGLIEVTVEVLR